MMMTDTKKTALSAALEFWRHRPSRNDYGMAQFPPQRTEPSYSANDVVDTAKVFAAFLDGEQKRKRR